MMMELLKNVINKPKIKLFSIKSAITNFRSRVLWEQHSCYQIYKLLEARCPIHNLWEKVNPLIAIFFIKLSSLNQTILTLLLWTSVQLIWITTKLLWTKIEKQGPTMLHLKLCTIQLIKTMLHYNPCMEEMVLVLEHRP